MRNKRNRRRPVYLSLRFYPGQDDDLLLWLEQFDGQQYGIKTQQVKAALRRAMEMDSSPAQGGQPAFDLAEMRRVVEAAVTSALANIEIYRPGAPCSNSNDDETEGLLAALGESLLLEE